MLYFLKLIFYDPLLYTLIILYRYVAFQDLGVAIVLLTILIRLILYPLFYKSFLSQTLMQKLQPAIEKIQHDHRHDREKQAQVLMALYREHKVNPFSSFLLLFIQLPVLIGLYNVFLHPPVELSNISLGLLDLSKTSIVIVVLAVIAQYLQGKLSLPKTENIITKESQAARMARQMIFIGPALTGLILWSLPAAVGLYWLVSSVFSIGQQLIINKKIKELKMIESNI